MTVTTHAVAIFIDHGTRWLSRPNMHYHLMMRLTVWIGVMVCAGTSPAVFAAENPANPNVLFIVVDDLNTVLGCYGHSVVRSPSIDRLAAHGVRFDRAYCQYPLCNPSRASFLSGRRPETTGVTGNGTAPRAVLGNVSMLPEHFRKNGYFTARVGKVAHDLYEDAIRWDVSENPHNRDGRDMYPEAYRGGRTTGGNFYVKLEWEATNRADEDEPDGCTARRVIELMEQHRDKPFFIAAGFYKPHLPFVAPQRYFKKYPADKIVLPTGTDERIPAVALTVTAEDRAMTDRQRRQAVAAYYACTTFMDAQVGKVLTGLDRLKLTDRTVVVLLSDHGFHLGEHGGLWRKMTLFTESTQVPLIVRAPGKQANKVCSRLVELVDLYPTLVELAGLPTPEGLEGTSFVPLLSDPTRAWKKAAFSMVTRFDGGPEKAFFGRSVRTERWRYSVWGKGRGQELYDLRTDPQEHHNLAAAPEHAGIVKELKGLLRDGWKRAKPSAD
jgi:uncharacterized sulfatase